MSPLLAFETTDSQTGFPMVVKAAAANTVLPL
jgi:hypothetical protein